MTYTYSRQRLGDRAPAAGFSTIEAIIALALLAIITAGLTETIIAAQKARTIGRQRSDAVRVAMAGIEQLRAHGRMDPAEAESDLDVHGELTPWDERLGIFRAEVVVVRRRRPPLTVGFSTLVFR